MNRVIDLSEHFQMDKINHITIEDSGFNDFKSQTIIKCCFEDGHIDTYSQQSYRGKIDPKLQKLIRITEMEIEHEYNFALNRSILSNHKPENTTISDMVPALDFNICELQTSKNKNKAYEYRKRAQQTPRAIASLDMYDRYMAPSPGQSVLNTCQTQEDEHFCQFSSPILAVETPKQQVEIAVPVVVAEPEEPMPHEQPTYLRSRQQRFSIEERDFQIIDDTISEPIYPMTKHVSMPLQTNQQILESQFEGSEDYAEENQVFASVLSRIPEYNEKEVKTFSLIDIQGDSNLSKKHVDSLQQQIELKQKQLSDKDLSINEIQNKLNHQIESEKRIHNELKKQSEEALKYKLQFEQKDLQLNQKILAHQAENQKSLQKTQKDMKMLKIIERMQLTTMKGIQKAFYQMKINCKIQKTLNLQDKLNVTIESHKKTIQRQHEKFNHLHKQLAEKDQMSTEYYKKLKNADKEIFNLKESMNEQLMQKDLELESLDIKLKLNNYQITSLKKHRLTKTAVARMLSRCKIDTQRAFFHLKMNAQVSKVNEIAEESIKVEKIKFKKEKFQFKQARKTPLVRRLILKKYLQELNRGFKMFHYQTMILNLQYRDQTIKVLRKENFQLKEEISNQSMSIQNMKDNQQDKQQIKDLTIKVRQLEDKYKDRVEENRKNNQKTNVLQKNLDSNNKELDKKDKLLKEQIKELNKLSQQLKVMDKNNKTNFKNEQKKRREKIVKMVILKMINNMKQGKQRAFYIMKMRAKEATFEIKMEETIKISKQQQKNEKMKSQNKQKRINLKRLVFGKYLRLQLRAFNKLKMNCKETIIQEKDMTVKNLEQQNQLINEVHQQNEQQLKKMEEKFQLGQMYKKKKKLEDQKKMEKLIFKNKDLEKQNKNFEEQNNTIKIEKLEKEKMIEEHLNEIEKIKKLLSDKEFELENERTMNQQELQKAQQRFNSLQQNQDQSNVKLEQKEQQINEQLTQLSKLQENLKSMDIQSKEKLKQEKKKREQKIMKMVISRMLLRMNSGQQKAFFLLKMNAQKINFEIQMDNTIKINHQNLQNQVLKGIVRQKQKYLKRMLWGKQLRQQLRAFNTLKTNCKEIIIAEQNFSLKHIEMKHTQLKQAQQKQDKQLNQIISQYEQKERQTSLEKTSVMKQLQLFQQKNQDLERRYKESVDLNETINIQQLQKDEMLKQHQSEIDKIKLLLDAKEQELLDERTINERELKSARDRLNFLQQNNDDNSIQIEMKDKFISQQIQELNKLQDRMKSMNDQSKEEIQQQEKIRKERIIKTVIGGMLIRMNSGKQKAFYLMKLNAQRVSFEIEMNETIKVNEKKQLLEKLTGISQQKKKLLKRIIWRKQFLNYLRAVNKLKANWQASLLEDKESNLKNLELKNFHLSDEKRMKDKKLNEIENDLTQSQLKHQRQKSEDFKKLNTLKTKFQNIEKQNKDMTKLNEKYKQEKDLNKQQLEQSQQEIDQIKQLLAEKELEIENERTYNMQELKQAQDWLSKLQKNNDEYTVQIEHKEKLISKQSNEMTKMQNNYSMLVIESKTKLRQEENKRRQKIIKMVIAKMLLKMNAGQQKAFFLMKLNAQKANFDIQMDNTIKINEQKLIFEKLTGMNKQKAKTLKRLVWGKQLRSLLKAFNTLKMNYKDQMIYERDVSVKNLQLANSNLNDSQQQKEIQLKKLEDKFQMSQIYKKKKKLEDQKKMEQLILKNSDLEKQNKEFEEINNSINFEKLKQETLVMQHQQELDRVKQLLAAKEEELENERTLNQREMRVAQEKFQSMSDQSQKIMSQQILEMQDRLNKQIKLNKDLKQNGITKKKAKAYQHRQMKSYGTGIEDAINELEEEEDQSWEDKKRNRNQRHRDVLYDDNVMGEINYDDDEAEENDQRQHVSLSHQRNSDASGSTSLASLLMMNEIPQYANQQEDNNDSDQFKIQHSSGDDNSGINIQDLDQIQVAHNDQGNTPFKLAQKVNHIRKNSFVSSKNSDSKSKISGGKQPEQEIIVNYFD